MDKDARQLLIITFLFLAVVITSFVATSESTPFEIHIISLIITIMLIVGLVVISYVFKKRG